MVNSRKHDQRFDDGALVRSDFRSAGRRINPNKTAQLCEQIRQAIAVALVSEVEDEELEVLDVEAVLPTNDPSRYLVVFAALAVTDEELDLDDLLERVKEQVDTWKSAVAESIHRKQIPELSFAVRFADS